MLRYTSDRFIDIELVTNIKTGLKIPVSSIVNKDFYVIPKGYETTGGESDEIGFLKETTNKSGETSSEFVNATVYAQQEDLYYVDQEDFLTVTSSSSRNRQNATPSVIRCPWRASTVSIRGMLCSGRL